VEGILPPECPQQEVESGKAVVDMFVVDMVVEDKQPVADTVAVDIQQVDKKRFVVHRRNCSWIADTALQAAGLGSSDNYLTCFVL